MNLRARIRNYQLTRYRNKQEQPNVYDGFERISSIALIFESSDNDKLVLEFARALRNYGKEVKLLGYIPKKRKDLMDIPPFSHFTKDEMGWTGKPSSEEVDTFLKAHYGALISLNPETDHPLEFMTTQIGADLKIGIKQSEEFDLVVGQNDNTPWEELFHEIEYYLKFINQKV